MQQPAIISITGSVTVGETEESSVAKEDELAGILSEIRDLLAIRLKMKIKTTDVIVLTQGEIGQCLRPSTQSA